MPSFLRRHAFYAKNRVISGAVRVYRSRKVNNRTIKVHPENQETKSIFVHIPKTAGYSVGKAIYGMDPGHYQLRQYQEIANLDDYFTFSVVRHPATRLASMHKYFQRLRVTAPAIADFKLANSFREFLEVYFELSKTTNHAMLWRQIDYLIDDTGNIGVDYLARMETISQDFETIKKRTNRLDVSLPHLNKSPGEHQVSQDELQIIKSNLAEEYDMLGYD